jgi:hypothetical protein
MRLRARWHLIAPAVLLVLMLSAGLSLAAAGRHGHGPKAASTVSCDATDGTPTDPPAEDPTTDDGTTPDGTTESDDPVDTSEDADDQGEDADDQGDADDESEEADDECADEADEAETADAPDAAPVVDPEREVACNEAAGVVEEPTAEEKLTGLDNAIAHVLANCIKNPQAPGLINALTHLVANKGLHEAHEAAKAERKAAHAAWKLEHASSHGHGHGGSIGS